MRIGFTGYCDCASYHIDGLDLRWTEWLVDVKNVACGSSSPSGFSFFSAAMSAIRRDIDRGLKWRKSNLRTKEQQREPGLGTPKYGRAMRDVTAHIALPRARPIGSIPSPPSELQKISRRPSASQLLQPLAGRLPGTHTVIMESSRVFVSGLPPKISNDQLKKHFSSRFQTTDAHVIPNRRIGFVGFKSPEAAKEAVGYFHKSYVKMSRISVEIARPVCHFGLLRLLHADR